MKKTENKRKEAGDGPLFVKKQYDIIFTNFIIPKVKKVFEGGAIQPSSFERCVAEKITSND